MNSFISLMIPFLFSFTKKCFFDLLIYKSKKVDHLSPNTTKTAMFSLLCTDTLEGKEYLFISSVLFFRRCLVLGRIKSK